MGKAISLDGTEISVIKALGFGGGDMPGKLLIEKASGLDVKEIIEALSGLMAVGYVVSDYPTINDSKELESAKLQVNSGYARDLKACIDPEDDEPKSRRIRRE